MNSQTQPHKEGAAPSRGGGARGGALLSSVPPPSELPQLVSLATTRPNLASNTGDANSPVVSPASIASPSMLASPSSPGDFIQTKFSPAIPAVKGEPTMATAPIEEGTSSDVSTPISGDSGRQSLNSAREADEYLGDIMPGSGILTWMKGAVASGGLLHRVAEKAKSSVDSMITTLDPQMKEYIYSGGDVEILVASDKEDKVSPVREAFQTVFGRATVIGFPSQSQNVAAQPLGFAAAISSAKDRITQLRSTNSKIGNNIPVVAVENFVIEVSNDKWFDLGVIILTDPVRGINIETFTQMTPVPSSVIAAAKGDTPQDYQFKDSGFSNTIGSYMAATLQVSHTQWHEEVTGVSRKEMIYLAAKALATIYKKSLNNMDK